MDNDFKKSEIAILTSSVEMRKRPDPALMFVRNTIKGRIANCDTALYLSSQTFPTVFPVHLLLIRDIHQALTFHLTRAGPSINVLNK